MKKNRIQMNYIFAKATWEAVKKVQSEKYHAFMEMKGITDDDITDENFEALNSEYEVFAKEDIENSKLAWNNLQLAEKVLLEFGISIAPAKIREDLANGVKWYLKIKLEIIDLILNFDVFTLPSALRGGDLK